MTKTPDELAEDFMKEAERRGLSPLDSHEDALKLAAALLKERQNKNPGRPPSKQLQDLILLAGFEVAKMKGDPRDDIELIRAIAKHNGWLTGDETDYEARIESLRSRLRYLRKPEHNYRRNAIEALRKAWPKSVEN